MVSAMSGSPTKTGWKRRSSAASFSMCLRNSSSVVAPIVRSSPRASIGLSRFAASTAPSDAPAPTIVCSSSMKRTICPSAWRPPSARPSSAPRTRRGTSPRRAAHRCRARRLAARRDSGTSPLTMRCARPSTIAVLPTPGSPISTGLFFVRRASTWSRGGSPRPSRSLGRACPPRVGGHPGRTSRALQRRLGVGRGDSLGPLTSAAAFATDRGWGARRQPGGLSVIASRTWVPRCTRRRAPHLALGALQDGEERSRGSALGGNRRRRRWEAGEQVLDASADRDRVGAELAQHGGSEPTLLVEQRREQVRGRDLAVAALGGESLSDLKGLTGLGGESIYLHGRNLTS